MEFRYSRVRCYNPRMAVCIISRVKSVDKVQNVASRYNKKMTKTMPLFYW